MARGTALAGFLLLFLVALPAGAQEAGRGNSANTEVQQVAFGAEVDKIDTSCDMSLEEEPSDNATDFSWEWRKPKFPCAKKTSTTTKRPKTTTTTRPTTTTTTTSTTTRPTTTTSTTSTTTTSTTSTTTTSTTSTTTTSTTSTTTTGPNATTIPGGDFIERTTKPAGNFLTKLSKTEKPGPDISKLAKLFKLLLGQQAESSIGQDELDDLESRAEAVEQILARLYEEVLGWTARLSELVGQPSSHAVEQVAVTSPYGSPDGMV